MLTPFKPDDLLAFIDAITRPTPPGRPKKVLDRAYGGTDYLASVMTKRIRKLQ
jgi:hypothetical protein